MKVLQINSVCKKGSTGKIAYEIYRRGNAAGHEFAVAYGRGKELEEKNIFKFGLDYETYAHALLTRLTGWTGRFSPLSTKRLLRFMDEFKPDIVHLHEPHAYFLDLEPFFEYLAAKKLPLVYTFHCEFAFTGKCGYSYDCTGYLTGCGSCPRLKEYPSALFFDRTAAMLSEKKRLLSELEMHIVTPSKWLADKAAGTFLSRHDIKVIPNGIDTLGVFYPRDARHLRERHALGDARVVLAVAPNFITDSRKGAEHIFRLAGCLENENIRFIMIGADREVSDCPANMIILGRTENQQELAEYYSLADCFVICSDMENFPTTCLEAVCCGTPVAGYDVGGTAETAPAPLGLFCPYGDTAALAANVMKLLSAPPAPEAFEKLQKAYSSETMFNEYMDVYKKILEGAKT